MSTGELGIQGFRTGWIYRRDGVIRIGMLRGTVHEDIGIERMDR